MLLPPQSTPFSLVWYTGEQWAKVKAGAVDPERFEDSYEAWLQIAEQALANLRATGADAEPCKVEADALLAWCLARGLPNHAAARARYVAERGREQALRGHLPAPGIEDSSLQMHRLKAEQAEQMQALLALFAEAFDDPASYSSNRPCPSYLRRLLGSEQFLALVARKGQRVVGAAVAYELRKFEQERSELYLYDAVDAAHRRQGIATALIRHLQQLASACGAYVICVQADLGDEAAIALYSKLGVREEVLHFDIPVRKPGLNQLPVRCAADLSATPLVKGKPDRPGLHRHSWDESAPGIRAPLQPLLHLHSIAQRSLTAGGA